MDDQAYPDEINLYDYLKIIYKWKFLIIALSLISAVATFIITSRLVPTTYKVTAVISPDSLSYTLDGRSLRVDSTANIHGLIQNGLFNQKIIEALNLDPAKFSAMQFNPQIIKQTEFIRVSYETPEPEKGKAIVVELINQISKSYKSKFILNQDEASKKIDKLNDILILQQNKKTRIQASKYRLQNHKKRLQNDKEALQNQGKRLQNKKARKNNERKIVENESELRKKELAIHIASEKILQDLLKTAEENISILINDKDKLLENGAKTDTASLILHMNTIQQSIHRVDKLNSDIENKKMTQEATRNKLIVNDIRLMNIDQDLNDIDTEIMDVAANINKLNTQIEDVDSQIKESTIQEKDIDIEPRTYLKEIESITKSMTSSSERIKVLEEPNADMVAKRTGVKVFSAGVVALLFGITLAFFIEFIKRSKVNIL